MGKKYLGLLTVVLLIGMVVTVSGCTSNSVKTDPKEDIYMNQLTLLPGYKAADGRTGWGVNFKLLSKTQTPYSHANITVVTTDSNNKVTSNNTFYVNYLPKEGKDITFFRTEEVAHVNITVINATQSS